MTVKSDRWIIDMSRNLDMINPFSDKQIKKGVISSGVSSYGYDMRISDEFKLPHADKRTVLDPKNIDELHFKEFRAEQCIIPANSFVIARTLEYFKIPRNIVTVCFGKSTYARIGVIVNVTPFEPEWEGYATISIINSSKNPVRIYANEGIAQLLFFESDEECLVSYADKKGKYQSQKKITLSRID